MINVKNCACCRGNHKDIELHLNPNSRADSSSYRNKKQDISITIFDFLFSIYPHKYFYFCPTDKWRNRIYVDVKNEEAVTKLSHPKTGQQTL